MIHSVVSVNTIVNSDEDEHIKKGVVAIDAFEENKNI